MKKQCLPFSSLTIFVAAFLVLGPCAYADDSSQFNYLVRVLQTHRAEVESQLGIKIKVTPRRPSLYYDGLLGDYEQELQVIRDVVEKDTQFNEQLKTLQAHRSRMESQLGIKEKPIEENTVLDNTLYEATLADHYEQVPIMKDQIDESIR